ncbi:hypothetical protein ACFVHB_09890 [Kitasatospora sp. NPDC127111]|uniref:hypothetical protein n=1 Tax=Kitasatospora sp. NPDC127111 TaxID=3345363 RepID=UPI0036332973
MIDERIRPLPRSTQKSARTLQERLEGALSNVRFTEKRIADLEAELIEHPRIWAFHRCRESTALGQLHARRPWAFALMNELEADGDGNSSPSRARGTIEVQQARC